MTPDFFKELREITESKYMYASYYINDIRKLIDKLPEAERLKIRDDKTNKLFYVLFSNNLRYAHEILKFLSEIGCSLKHCRPGESCLEFFIDRLYFRNDPDATYFLVKHTIDYHPQVIEDLFTKWLNSTSSISKDNLNYITPFLARCNWQIIDGKLHRTYDDDSDDNSDNDSDDNSDNYSDDKTPADETADLQEKYSKVIEELDAAKKEIADLKQQLAQSTKNIEPTIAYMSELVNESRARVADLQTQVKEQTKQKKEIAHHFSQIILSL